MHCITPLFASELQWPEKHKHTRADWRKGKAVKISLIKHTLTQRILTFIIGLKYLLLTRFTAVHSSASVLVYLSASSNWGQADWLRHWRGKGTYPNDYFKGCLTFAILFKAYLSTNSWMFIMWITGFKIKELSFPHLEFSASQASDLGLSSQPLENYCTLQKVGWCSTVSYLCPKRK